MPNAKHRLPQELSAVRRRLRGLDQDGVRRLLEREQAQRADVEQRLAELQESHAAQRAELDELRDRERLITGALATAQRAADEILEEARHEAERRVDEAEAEAERRLDVAEQQLAQLTELARTLAGELIERAGDLRSTLAEARERFGAAPDVPPPAPPPPGEAAVEPAVDDLPPEGERTVRLVLGPIGSPAAVAAAERRIHGLAGVRTVRLGDLADQSATLLVGVDTDQLDVVPLLDAGAELISADRDAIELRVPEGWS